MGISPKRKVLVLGGYGTFGSRISRALAADPLIDCVVAGRSAATGEKFSATIGASFAALDISDPRALHAALSGVFAVVHTCGPFQASDYRVAEACIAAGVHYIDLADARAFVAGISRLDSAAHARGCRVAAGASSVPAVSAALVDSLVGDFDCIDEIHSAISPGNRNPRGRATVRAILSYTGGVINLWERGHWRVAHGWSEPVVVDFPAPVGQRRVYLCDVPDLELFPYHYRAHTVTFRAGLELNLFNFGLAILGRLRQHGWLSNLPRLAELLIAVSQWFASFGTAAGGMRVVVRGSRHGRLAQRQAYLIARDTNGPAIPCSPSIALIKKWVRDGIDAPGAGPCLSLVTLDELRAEWLGCDIVVVLS